MKNLLLKNDLDSSKTYYEYLEIAVFTEKRMPKYLNFMPTNKSYLNHALSCAISKKESGKILKVEKLGKHYRLKDKWLS